MQMKTLYLFAADSDINILDLLEVDFPFHVNAIIRSISELYLGRRADPDWILNQVLINGKYLLAQWLCE